VSFKQLSPVYRHVFIAMFMFMTWCSGQDYSIDTTAGENIHYSKALEVDKRFLKG